MERGEDEASQEEPEAHGSVVFTGQHTADFEDQVYNVYAVQEYTRDFPVETVPTGEFADAVAEGQKYWSDVNGESLGPHDILADWDAAKQNELWAKHVAGIEAANLEYPILVHRESGYVFDGVHRLTKAFLQHEPTIKVKYFDTLPESAIVPDHRQKKDT